MIQYYPPGRRVQERLVGQRVSPRQDSWHGGKREAVPRPIRSDRGERGALTGLLFVALSVAPRPVRTSRRHVIQQVRASAALLAFNNALAVSLFGLVPTNVGYPGGGARRDRHLVRRRRCRSVIAAAPNNRRGVARQVVLLNLLMVIFGTELVCAIYVLVRPASIDSRLHRRGAAFVGIARAWELVGDRDTGLSVESPPHRPRAVFRAGRVRVRTSEDGPGASRGRAREAPAEPPGMSRRRQYRGPESPDTPAVASRMNGIMLPGSVPTPPEMQGTSRRAGATRLSHCEAHRRPRRSASRSAAECAAGRHRSPLAPMAEEQLSREPMRRIEHGEAIPTSPTESLGCGVSAIDFGHPSQ